jgi:peroxiredoxin Q/BCP
METGQAPTMPAAWTLTGAFILGLGMYSLRTATLAVTGQRSAPAGQRASVSMGLAVGDKFPEAVLSKCGVKGKKAVVFFYGADDAPSCSKEISAFEEAAADFKAAGVAVVGVRNPAGVKDGTSAVKLVVDDGDEMRKEVGIEKDLFGLLGGRETYVLDASGSVASVHNNQFDPKSHINVFASALKFGVSADNSAPNCWVWKECRQIPQSRLTQSHSYRHRKTLWKSCLRSSRKAGSLASGRRSPPRISTENNRSERLTRDFHGLKFVPVFNENRFAMRPSRYDEILISRQAEKSLFEEIQATKSQLSRAKTSRRENDRNNIDH